VPLKLEDKKAIVEEVAKVAKDAVSVVVADYRGVGVSAMTTMRKKAREQGIYLRVVRNTLAKRALQGTEFACVADALQGAVFLAFSQTELGAAAKLLREIAKENENLKVRALVVGGQLLGPEKLSQIADLPTREQALSLVLSLLKAPLAQLARTIAEPHARLARVISKLPAERK
jgi:large subunit ribosomal protein L10